MRKAWLITDTVLTILECGYYWYSSISKLGNIVLDVTTKPQSKIKPTSNNMYHIAELLGNVIELINKINIRM